MLSDRAEAKEGGEKTGRGSVDEGGGVWVNRRGLERTWKISIRSPKEGLSTGVGGLGSGDQKREELKERAPKPHQYYDS